LLVERGGLLVRRLLIGLRRLLESWRLLLVIGCRLLVPCPVRGRLVTIPRPLGGGLVAIMGTATTTLATELLGGCGRITTDQLEHG